MTKVKIDPANLTGDDSYLNDYVIANTPGNDDKARLKQVLSEIGGMSDDSGATDDDRAVSDFLGESDVKNKKLAELQKEADRLQVSTERSQKEEEAAAIEERQALREENITTQQRIATGLNDKVATPAINAGKGIVGRVSSLPTVGSIGMLLALLIILLFVVVNVDGKGTTRLKQLWYMINGRATLKGRVSVTKGSQKDGSNVPGANIPGVNNGSSTGQGNGKLPKPGKRTGPTDKAKFDESSANLMRELTIGNFNGDIVDQWGALNANFALRGDVDSNAGDTKIASDLTSLNTSLNKLNDPLYNSDYGSIFHDLGF